jgi:spore maturation protein CgeB
MKILYLGINNIGSTSRHRIEALKRIGNEVEVIEPSKAYKNQGFVAYLHYNTGYKFVLKAVEEYVLNQIKNNSYDLIFVNHGHDISANLLKKLKSNCSSIINYNLDNIFSNRDGNRFNSLKKAIPYYDLIVVPRNEDIEKAKTIGAKKVTCEYQAYDPIFHTSETALKSQLKNVESDVCFVGTWMPERAPFMEELIQKKVPIKIYGIRWHKSKNWKILQKNYVDSDTFDSNYVKILASSKISICLLSWGNKDLCTNRSFEIPSIGSLLCAQRTSVHEKFYKDRVEACFWNDAYECAEICHELLNNPAKRISIAKAGHEAVLRSGQSNDEVLARIIKAAGF